MMGEKTMFTIADCGCVARAWQESDGSEWVDFELCKLHASAPELRSENARLKSMLSHDEWYYRNLVLDENEQLQAENARLREALDFHPRATKLMLKQKSFIVIACDEPYFADAYKMIREHEISKDTWNGEDEMCYLEALKGGN